MSADINKWIGTARLTRDAEASYTQSGYAILKFGAAVNRRIKKGEEWVDEASFFDFVIWGKRGEALAQYMVKGTQVAIEGTLKQERWEKDGQKRSKVSIDVDNIQLLGGKGNSQPQQNNRPAAPAGPPAASFESDILFAPVF